MMRAIIALTKSKHHKTKTGQTERSSSTTHSKKKAHYLPSPFSFHHHHPKLQHTMTTVESYLTRRFDIRFIDARCIANEAKVNLGIEGYPTKAQQIQIRKEACQIFCDRPDISKDTMRRLSATLDEVMKICPPSSGSSSLSSDTNSYFDLSADDVESTTRSIDTFGTGYTTTSSTSSKGKRAISNIFRLGRRLTAADVNTIKPKHISNSAA